MEYKIGSKIRVRVCDNRIYTILDIDGDYVKIKEGLSVHKCHISPLIDEEKLDELANEFADNIIETTKDEPFPKDVEDSVWFGIVDGYKAGYRKAMEE